MIELEPSPCKQIAGARSWLLPNCPPLIWAPLSWRPPLLLFTQSVLMNHCDFELDNGGHAEGSCNASCTLSCRSRAGWVSPLSIGVSLPSPFFFFFCTLCLQDGSAQGLGTSHSTLAGRRRHRPLYRNNRGVTIHLFKDQVWNPDKGFVDSWERETPPTCGPLGRVIIQDYTRTQAAKGQRAHCEKYMRMSLKKCIILSYISKIPYILKTIESSNPAGKDFLSVFLKKWDANNQY